MGILTRAFKTSIVVFASIASLLAFAVLLIVEIEFIQSIVGNKLITILIVIAVNTFIGALISEIYNHFTSKRNK